MASTTYTLNSKTVNSILVHSTPLSANDLAKLNNNPNLIGKLALETTGATKTIPELDMVMDRGQELLDFNTLTSQGTGWVFSNGVLYKNADDATLYNFGVNIESGKKYSITYSKLNHTAGDPSLSIAGVTTGIQILNEQADGEYEIILNATNTGTLGIAGNIARLEIHSLSVKEVVQDSYYMCSEKSGAYLVDSRSVGTEKILNGTFDTDTVWSKVTGWTISGGVAVANIANGALSQPLISFVSGRTYKVIYTVSNYSAGTFYSRIGAIGNEGQNVTSNGTFTDIITWDGNGTNFNIYGTVSAVGNIDNVSVQEVNVNLISNYASTVRTNADLQQKGIQQTAFVTDGAGVPTAYSSNLLQFNGDGRYVDTGFMPPSDSAWEIDLVIETLLDGTNKWTGCVSTSTANWLLIEQHSAGKIIAYVGSESRGTALAVSDGLHYVRIEFDGAGNGNVVIDNTETLSYAGSTYTYSGTESFFIGTSSRAGVAYLNPLKNPTGQFQYTARARTADERNTYYAQLKTIYPSLP